MSNTQQLIDDLLSKVRKTYELLTSDDVICSLASKMKEEKRDPYNNSFAEIEYNLHYIIEHEKDYRAIAFREQQLLDDLAKQKQDIRDTQIEKNLGNE